jgi:hypothetical protein
MKPGREVMHGNGLGSRGDLNHGEQRRMRCVHHRHSNMRALAVLVTAPDAVLHRPIVDKRVLAVGVKGLHIAKRPDQFPPLGAIDLTARFSTLSTRDAPPQRRSGKAN